MIPLWKKQVIEKFMKVTRFQVIFEVSEVSRFGDVSWSVGEGVLLMCRIAGCVLPRHLDFHRFLEISKIS